MIDSSLRTKLDSLRAAMKAKPDRTAAEGKFNSSPLRVETVRYELKEPQDGHPTAKSPPFKREIGNFGAEAQVSEVGEVLSVGDGIATSMASTMSGRLGQSSFRRHQGHGPEHEADNVWLRDFRLRPHHQGRRHRPAHQRHRETWSTRRPLDPWSILGNPIDGKGELTNIAERRRVDVKPRASFRASRCARPVQTGSRRSSLIDRPRPAGLIIGDRQNRQDRGGDRRHHQQGRQRQHRRKAKLYCICRHRRSVRRWRRSSRPAGRCRAGIYPSSSARHRVEPAPAAIPGALFRLRHGRMVPRHNGTMRDLYDDLSKQAVAYRRRCRCCCAVAGPRSLYGDVFYLRSACWSAPPS